MTNLEILNTNIPLIDFIADICGPNYEVVLHDVTKPERSVIAIRNGHITGRTVGSPMTDLALRILKKREYLTRDLITNYDGYNDTSKVFLSSTYFIKNNGSLIGMICVNNDVSDVIKLEDSIKSIMQRFKYRDEVKEEEIYKENLKQSLESTAHEIIRKTINESAIPAERMSVDEKVNIVQQLDSEGIFLLKGTIPLVADLLDISDSTAYRYLNKAQYKRESN